MSHKYIPTKVATLVCDLCGNPLDTYSNNDRANLKYATTPIPSAPAPTHWMLHWSSWRDRKQKPVGSGFATMDDLYDTTVNWDFHGECLVRTLRPIVEASSSSEKES